MMTMLTVHAGQQLQLIGAAAPSGQVVALDAAITVKDGGELANVNELTYVSGGVTVEHGGKYRTDRCGDGAVDLDDGEECDAGMANADVPDAPCRAPVVPCPMTRGVLVFARQLLEWAKSKEAAEAGLGLDQAELERFVKRVVQIFTENYATQSVKRGKLNGMAPTTSAVVLSSQVKPRRSMNTPGPAG